MLRSAQRALLGNVTPALRSVSFDRDDETIFARAVFDPGADEDEREQVSIAFTEVIADYGNELIDETFLLSSADLTSLNLRLVAFQRYEPLEGDQV